MRPEEQNKAGGGDMNPSSAQRLEKGHMELIPIHVHLVALNGESANSNVL